MHSDHISAQNIEKLNTTELVNDFGSKSKVLRTYPNPNSGDRIFVELENYGVREPVTIDVHDVMGRLVKTTKGLTDEQGRLNAEISLNLSLRKEIYIIRASSPSGVKQSKIIIE